MKCPRCGTTIKKWRLLEDTGHVDDPTKEPPSEESFDWKNYETIHTRCGQCTKCFAYCGQILSTGALQNTYPVTIRLGNLTNMCIDVQ